MRRNAKIMAGFMAVLLLLALPCLAQPEGDGPLVLDTDAIKALQNTTTVDFSDDETSHPIQEEFNQVLKLFQEGFPEDARARGLELKNKCRRTGLMPNEEFAVSLAYAARRAQGANELTKAQSMLDLAEEFAPDSPLAPLSRAELILTNKGLGGLGEALLYMIDGYSKLGNNPRWSLITKNNIVLFLCGALFFVLTVFVLAMLVKYQSRVRHDVWEKLEGKLGDRLARLAGWMFLALPMFLLLGGYWLILYWFVIAFVYMRVSEKITAAVLLLLLVSTFPVQNILLSQLIGYHTPIGTALYRTERGVVQRDLDGMLHEAVTKMGDESSSNKDIFSLLKAQRYMKSGNYSAANQILITLTKESSRPEHALLLQGNIEAAQENWRGALGRYSKAIEANPRYAEAYWNRQYAYINIFEQTKASGDRNQALKIRPNLQKLEKIGRGEANILATPPIPPEKYMELGMAYVFNDPQTEFTKIQYDPDSPSSAFFNSLFLWTVMGIVAGVVLAFVRKDSLTSLCNKCGRAFQAGLRSAEQGPNFCTQCHHIYVKQDGVLPEARLAKNYEVEAYQRRILWTRRIAGFLVPGGGTLLDDMPLLGLPLTSLWALLLSIILLKGQALPLPFLPSPNISSVLGNVLALIMALIWLGFGIKSLLRRT